MCEVVGSALKEMKGEENVSGRPCCQEILSDKVIFEQRLQGCEGVSNVNICCEYLFEETVQRP